MDVAALGGHGTRMVKVSTWVDMGAQPAFTRTASDVYVPAAVPAGTVTLNAKEPFAPGATLVWPCTA